MKRKPDIERCVFYFKSDKSYWFATSYGLARIYYDRDRYVFDKTNVFAEECDTWNVAG